MLVGSPAGQSAVIEAMRIGCAAILAPGQVAELRVMGVAGRQTHTAAGWFNDPEELVRAACVEDSREALGVYLTLNPLHEGCLARSPNRLAYGVRSTSSDRDVTARCWLPIDIDPVRPQGVSSTEAEVEAAVSKAREVIDLLEKKHGYPPGVRAHSGNGIHLLYRVDLPADDDAKELVAAFLRGLDSLFSDDKAKIDVSVSNAARIWKLPGSVARKGQSVADRPHRRSAILPRQGEFPVHGSVGVVPVGLVEAVAAFAPAKGRPGRPKAQPKAGAAVAAAPRRRGRPPGPGAKPRAASPAKPSRFDNLQGYLESNGVKVRSVEEWDGGTRILLDACVFDPAHTGTSASFGRTAAGAIWYKCQHESCADLGWNDVREMFESDAPPASKSDSFPEDPWDVAKLALKEIFADEDFGAVLLRRHREAFYRYIPAKHCYIPASDDAMMVALTRWAGGKVAKLTKRAVADILHCVASMVTTPEDIDIPFRSQLVISDDDGDSVIRSSSDRRAWVSLQNGIVDLDEALSGRPLRECLIPSTPEWFSTVCLPFKFPASETDATCPQWEMFLAEVFEDDRERIDLVQEMTGLCLFPTAEFETFFVLSGIGRNGKSTYLQILRNLLGDANVSSLSIEHLGNDFMIETLRGKLANISADMSELDSVAEGLLKAIVSGDLVTADRKHKNPTQFSPTCKMIFATNVLPRFKDTSLGIWRRMVVVPFNYVVPEEKVDNRLIDKLSGELDGIFIWALKGAQRLFHSRKLTRPRACEAAQRQYRIDCFPIMLFVEECCRIEPDGTAIVKDLYRVYKQWGLACGLSKPKPLHNFIRDLISFVPGLSHDRLRAGMAANAELYGITIRESLQLGDVTTDEQRSLYR